MIITKSQFSELTAGSGDPAGFGIAAGSGDPAEREHEVSAKQFQAERSQSPTRFAVVSRPCDGQQ